MDKTTDKEVKHPRTNIPKHRGEIYKLLLLSVLFYDFPVFLNEKKTYKKRN